MKITVAVITLQDYEKFNAVGMNAEACLADRVKLICQDDAGHVAESFMKQDEFDRLGLAYIEQHAKLEHSEVCDEWFMKCSQNSWYNDLERNPEKVIKVMFVGIEDGTGREVYHGQWDGYPEGQGITALTFLRDKMDLELFKEALRNSSYIPSEELTALWKQYGADENGWITMEDSDRMMEDHPEFSRNTGAGILEMVQNHSEGMKLQDSINFAADGLFCEWAWVIDLDAGTLRGTAGSARPLWPRMTASTSCGIWRRITGITVSGWQQSGTWTRFRPMRNFLPHSKMMRMRKCLRFNG